LKALPGTFTNASLSINLEEIAQPSVYYTFTLQPGIAFNESAVIQLKFPDEFWIGDDCVYIPKSESTMQRGRYLTVFWNQVVEIRGAFLSEVS